MYNYDYKKSKLPSNPYCQLLVHNVASTFLGKRRDRYEVRIFFLVLKLDSEAIVVIRMFMRSRAQEKDRKSRETGKGSFVGFIGLVWLNFQLCRLWLCGFGPLEFGQCTTTQPNLEWDIYIYILMVVPTNEWWLLIALALV